MPGGPQQDLPSAAPTTMPSRRNRNKKSRKARKAAAKRLAASGNAEAHPHEQTGSHSRDGPALTAPSDGTNQGQSQQTLRRQGSEEDLIDLFDDPSYVNQEPTQEQVPENLPAETLPAGGKRKRRKNRGSAKTRANKSGSDQPSRYSAGLT